MNQQFWEGTAVTVALCVLGWLCSKSYDYIQGLKLENKSLKDEEDKALRKRMEILTKDLNINTLALTKLEVQLKQIELIVPTVLKLKGDIDQLHTWKREEEEVDSSSS